jgi:hypothetical protein
MARAKSARWRLPGVKTTRSGTPSTSTVSVVSSFPTTKATRYVDIFMVGAKRTTFLSPYSLHVDDGGVGERVDVAAR